MPTVVQTCRLYVQAVRLASYGRVKIVLEEVKAGLEQQYMNDAASGSLDEEGDALRRAAALKRSVLDDVTKALLPALKKEL